MAKLRAAAFEEMTGLKRKDLLFASDMKVREGRRSELRLQVAIFWLSLVVVFFIIVFFRYRYFVCPFEVLKKKNGTFRCIYV